MKVSDAKGILKVGDVVITNGDGKDSFSDFVRGVVGEINGDSFYVWQDTHDGSAGSVFHVGYKYSWAVSFSNATATIEINPPEAPKPSLYEELLEAEMNSLNE